MTTADRPPTVDRPPTADRPTTIDEIDLELARNARRERWLVRDQGRAERRLVKAARRSDVAEARLARLQARVARAAATADERRAALGVAVAAVQAAVAARGVGPNPTEEAPEASTTDEQPADGQSGAGDER